MAYHTSEVSTKNAPALAYPKAAGFTFPANLSPDTGDSNLVIRMTLTTLGVVTRKAKVNVVQSSPILSGSLAYGASTISQGAMEVPKLQVEGFIDTPSTTTTPILPQLTAGSINYSYAEYIAMCWDGSAGNWNRIDPAWFRDPYGRVYANPQVFDFTASYVEGIPGRTNFTMVLAI